MLANRGRRGAISVVLLWWFVLGHHLKKANDFMNRDVVVERAIDRMLQT